MVLALSGACVKVTRAVQPLVHVSNDITRTQARTDARQLPDEMFSLLQLRPQQSSSFLVESLLETTLHSSASYAIFALQLTACRFLQYQMSASSILRAAALIAVVLLFSPTVVASRSLAQAAPSAVDVYNFALNLEYLEVPAVLFTA